MVRAVHTGGVTGQDARRVQYYPGSNTSTFTAIGVDAAVLARSTETLLAQFKSTK